MNDPRRPRPGPGQGGAGDEEYSATALGSHWFEHPEHPEHPEPRDAVDTPTAVLGHSLPDATAVLGHSLPDATAVLADPLPGARDAVPDRAEGDVLRFGPGVTAAVRRQDGAPTNVDIWHGTLAGQSGSGGPPRRRGRALRRSAPVVLALLAVLAFLAWQRFGPGVSVRGVAVRTPADGPGCDGTADVVGVVRTDGRPGTLTYRWLRGDGTTSGPLHEKVTRGQQQARLHLRWTFHGRGEYHAHAELEVMSPSRHTASARFVYACP
ncbi:hypothetical protein J7E88_09130 [Streptomyces sp. ISL-10]|uniref:hypothetical protein n=1 Tax=Streptomyces sp. ISL-10 TaxID=2819172 RepID=UPI001BE5F50F|nr:hypothetical protein [Streptomyces sp. ISL-10]MBT2365478.1 hypothetical protein [Streptomyces sp. ISL-10]